MPQVAKELRDQQLIQEEAINEVLRRYPDRASELKTLFDTLISDGILISDNIDAIAESYIHKGGLLLSLLGKSDTHNRKQNPDRKESVEYLNRVFNFTDIKEKFNSSGLSDVSKEEIVRMIVSELGFSHILTPSVVPAVSNEAPVIGLPAYPPELWVDRKDREETPPEFIKRVYATWLGRGLTRQWLKNDPPLYNAYATWISRHPADKLDLPTRSDLVSRKLDEADASMVEDASRLAAAARMRQLRAG